MTLCYFTTIEKIMRKRTPRKIHWQVLSQKDQRKALKMEAPGQLGKIAAFISDLGLLLESTVYLPRIPKAKPEPWHTQGSLYNKSISRKCTPWVSIGRHIAGRPSKDVLHPWSCWGIEKIPASVFPRVVGRVRAYGMLRLPSFHKNKWTKESPRRSVGPSMACLVDPHGSTTGWVSTSLF